MEITARRRADAAQIQPQHCHDCYRLIRPGQTYYLTIDNAILCPDCIRAADAIRLRGGLTVEVGEDRLLVRRGDDAVEVLPREVRHLVDASVEGVVRLALSQNPCRPTALSEWLEEEREPLGTILRKGLWRLPLLRFSATIRAQFPATS